MYVNVVAGEPTKCTRSSCTVRTKKAPWRLGCGQAQEDCCRWSGQQQLKRGRMYWVCEVAGAVDFTHCNGDVSRWTAGYGERRSTVVPTVQASMSWRIKQAQNKPICHQSCCYVQVTDLSQRWLRPSKPLNLLRRVSEWLSSFLTAHQHNVGYTVPC